MPSVSSFRFPGFVTQNAHFAIVNAQIAELNAQFNLGNNDKKSPVILNVQFPNLISQIVRLTFQFSEIKPIQID